MLTSIKIGVFIVDKKNRLLLIKEENKTNPEPRWNIIKGTYGDVKNRGKKETVIQTAQRESLEEISVKIKVDRVQGCYIINKKNDTQIQINFEAHIIKGNPKLPSLKKQKKHNESIVDYKWFTKKEIKNLKKNNLISEKIYIMVTDWLLNDRSSLSLVRNVTI